MFPASTDSHPATPAKTPDSRPSFEEKQGGRTFAQFPHLPTELRLKIWEFSFVPRRVYMIRNTGHPDLDPRSGALLLVNRESHAVFLSKYTRCFADGGRDGLYFNFTLDTFVYSTKAESLRRLFERCPADTARIRWLELHPYIGIEGSHALDMTRLSSLRLIYFLSDPQRTWKGRSDELPTRHDRAILKLSRIIKLFAWRVRNLEFAPKPKFVAIFSPDDTNCEQFTAAVTKPAHMISPSNLKELSEEAMAKIESCMPDDWIAAWPGRTHAVEKGWFAHEIL